MADVIQSNATMGTRMSIHLTSDDYVAELVKLADHYEKAVEHWKRDGMAPDRGIARCTDAEPRRSVGCSRSTPTACRNTRSSSNA
jgi:hypothetical protein